MSSDTVKASCLCGGVTWEIDGPVTSRAAAGTIPHWLQMANCHCSRCRKSTGAPFGVYLTVREDKFRLTGGRDLIAVFESSPGATRPFCSRCGSTVPDGVPWKGRVAMPAGCFDGDPGLAPRCHIFAASKATWFDITDDLQRFDAYPPGFDAPLVEERASGDPASEGTRGSCLCDSVRYVMTKPAIRCRTCHCGRCRKTSASTFMSYIITTIDGGHYTRGEELVTTFKVPEARYFKTAFCSRCGSKMPRVDRERGIFIVAMGSLDDPPSMKPTSHIYVGSRAPWDHIDDGLPQFEEYPPS